ncbi:helix-turn-helix transcriptional regulator [Streptomyces sp. ME01-24h]|nr:helix-turn-helix transcriptional regulator [Streptomyces sp. ME19-03-3]MDX3354996.1 helix-turn-helix transcriptional regulator [Streptomyces sp. ME01-24h]
MTTVQSGSGSMVRRILLGSQLRRLREAQGITREAAGYSIRASESKISRMELGRVSFKERDVADLLTLYGITDDFERTALLGLVREANVAGWWHGFGDVLPAWFQTYVGLEESASDIRSFETQFVHGLLQADDYSRAVIELGHPNASADEVERRIVLRQRRQKLLTSEHAPRITAVMDEAVVLRGFGGRQVMRAQLAHLVEVSQQPHVTVQLLPLAFTGYSAGASGTFTQLTFPEPDVSDVVYVEQLTGAMYIDKREEVDQYRVVMARLRADCLSPEATRDRLNAVLRDI